MIFRVAFAYALLRGLLDWLTRRPDLQRRLFVMRLNKAFRATRPAMQRLAESTLAVAADFRRFYHAHREYERWVGQYERGES